MTAQKLDRTYDGERYTGVLCDSLVTCDREDGSRKEKKKSPMQECIYGMRNQAERWQTEINGIGDGTSVLYMDQHRYW